VKENVAVAGNPAPGTADPRPVSGFRAYLWHLYV